ncbi:hypothetical protein, partial [Burkholderia mallei]|uniref:hypothetical protein n=1 Tax=Burkholderia mallei TaxID=13373 RepID=UPI000169E2B3
MGPAKQRFAGPSIRRHRFSRHRRTTATDSTRRATANDARRTDNKAPAPTGAPIRTAREAVA